MKQPRLLLSLIVVASLAIAALVAGCDSEAGPTATATPTASATSEATPTVIATVAPSATATGTAAPTATPGPPRLERFAAGEVIDVAPAVVFVDVATGEAEAWVTPGAFPEVAVAPDGSYVVYQIEDRVFHLLRTDDGSERPIAADSLPIELGPGGAGFVAATQDRSVVSAFDGQGEHLGELWLGGLLQPWAVSWSADGERIAHVIAPGGGPQMTVTITSVADWASIVVDAGLVLGGAAVEWSRDSQRLAVVTERHLQVFDRAGELLGSFADETGGDRSGPWSNPRWSADDRYLFVDEMPRLGGELAHVFDADGEPVFRFFTPSYAGGCGGEVWIDGSTIEFGEYDVRVDGTFELHDRQRRDVWSVERLGVTLAEGIAFHLPHSGVRDGYAVHGDGRVVFNTITWGGDHGGCGEAWSGSRETESTVEWPPYQPRRSRG